MGDQAVKEQLANVPKMALVVSGDHTRIRKLLCRADKGEKLCIGFLGGSITQGSLASVPENCYAALVYRWWVETFPQSTFTFVNAGIGGTTSLFGAARAKTDILQYKPDFVAVDFTVNDENTAFFQETFEGVLRQLLLAANAPAVMVLHNAFYEDGRNAQEKHAVVTEHYQIPSVSVRESVSRLIREGVLTTAQVSPDGLHPNDLGHRLLADMLIAQLEKDLRELRQEGFGAEPDVRAAQLDDQAAQLDGHAAQINDQAVQPDDHAAQPEGREMGQKEPACPPPVTKNRFENAKRYQTDNCGPELDGFVRDTRPKTELLDLYKNGWMGCNPGDQITFSLKCSHISVQFLRAVKRDRLTALAVVDGDEEHAVFLDGNFDEDWGDCLALQPVFESGELAAHTLTITIQGTELADAKPFYLVSIITD